MNRTPVRKTAAGGPGPAACESVQNCESESEVICMPVILASLTRTMIAAGSESSRRLVTPPDGAADSNATDSDGRGVHDHELFPNRMTRIADDISSESIDSDRCVIPRPHVLGCALMWLGVVRQRCRARLRRRQTIRVIMMQRPGRVRVLRAGRFAGGRPGLNGALGPSKAHVPARPPACPLWEGRLRCVERACALRS